LRGSYIASRVRNNGKRLKEKEGVRVSKPLAVFCSAGLAGHQAKTVTNNLPILSVLAASFYFFL